MTAEEMTYNQYAKEYGFVTDYEVLGHIHAGLMAAHMPKIYHARFQAKLRELQDGRAQGQKAYQSAIDSGEVMPPKELSYIEEMTERAKGHPDLPSTQAALRLIAKIDKKRFT